MACSPICIGEPKEKPGRGHPQDRNMGAANGLFFAAEKTELIHLTRSKMKYGVGQIIMDGRVIKPADAAKLLEIVFGRGCYCMTADSTRPNPMKNSIELQSEMISFFSV